MPMTWWNSSLAMPMRRSPPEALRFSAVAVAFPDTISLLGTWHLYPQPGLLLIARTRELAGE